MESRFGFVDFEKIPVTEIQSQDTLYKILYKRCSNLKNYASSPRKSTKKLSTPLIRWNIECIERDIMTINHYVRSRIPMASSVSAISRLFSRA